MFLSGKLINIKIRSVFELSWGHGKRIPETRPCYALSLRLQGGATFFYKNKTIHARDNDVIFFPKNLTYTIEHTSEHVLVIHFDTDTPMPDDIMVLNSDKTFLIRELFASIYTSWLSAKMSDKYSAHSAFYQLLSELTRAEEHNIYDDSRLATVTNYIHDHFRESNLSPSVLAELFGTSETYFRKKFLEHHNVSPLKYINSLRLKYACELLQFSYYSINEIAEMSGFRDPKYFSRFIKVQTGAYPSDIRKNAFSP